MDYAKAASYQTAYLTAYVALYRRGDLQPGEHLLVHGATGGVGMAAVDLGKHFGAQVIGTGGRDDKLAVVQSRGLTMLLTTSNGWFVRRLSRSGESAYRGSRCRCGVRPGGHRCI